MTNMTMTIMKITATKNDNNKNNDIYKNNDKYEQ